MLKSFLQLNINYPHNKSQYSIKKNKLILLSNNNQSLNSNNSHNSYKGFNTTSSINRNNKNQDSIISSHINSSHLTYTYSNTNKSKQQQSSPNKLGTKSRFSANRISQDQNSNFSHSKCSKSNFSNITPERKSIQQNNILPSQVKFDCITYDYKSTNQKILYDFLMLKPSTNKQTSMFDIQLPNSMEDNFFTSLTNQDFKFNHDSVINSQPQSNQPLCMTIVFNYDIQYEKLQQLLIQLMEIKKFQQSKFKIAHFQLRNNHISDYNKSSTTQQKKRKNRNSDQMQTFTKQIDTCIKLDKTWKIIQNISYKQYNRKDYKQKDIMNKNSRTNYDKKTNQFFICDIDNGKYELNIIVLHRQKDYILTKNQDKQIQQAFILLKNSISSNDTNNSNGINVGSFNQQNHKNQKINLQFNTSLVQIINSYLLSSDQVIFVSQYPTLNNCSSQNQLLKIPIKIQQNRPQQVQKIIQKYNKQKQTKLQNQMLKMKVKLRQIHHKRKTTQQNITYLMKKYKKGFQNIFDSLNYLKSHNITDLYSFKSNLQNQIKQKQEEIKDTMENLKNINYQIIMSEQRNQYFKQKMEILKQNLQQDLQQLDCGISNKSKRSTQVNSPNKNNNCNKQNSPNKSKVIHDSVKKTPASPIKPQNENQLTQTILKKFLQVEQQSENPYSVQLRRQVQKYSNELRQKTRQRLMKSRQVDQFHNLMDQLRKKLSKSQFTKLEKKYLGLISMC